MIVDTEKSIARVVNVLLVDDNEDVAVLVKQYLKDPRIALTVANNGRDGFETFKNGGFDLVLMDIEMPVLDGLEATKAIRLWENQKDLEKTPIAALTARTSMETLSEIYAAGCTQYLAKPIAKNVLLQTLGQYSKSSGPVTA
jgi:CheY-like chemotaxis protein